MKFFRSYAVNRFYAVLVGIMVLNLNLLQSEVAAMRQSEMDSCLVSSLELIADDEPYDEESSSERDEVSDIDLIDLLSHTANSPGLLLSKSYSSLFSAQLLSGVDLPSIQPPETVS